MSPQNKTLLVSILSAIVGALSAWSLTPATGPVVCPVCVPCPVVVEIPPVEVLVETPVEVVPVVAPVVP